MNASLTNTFEILIRLWDADHFPFHHGTVMRIIKFVLWLYAFIKRFKAVTLRRSEVATRDALLKKCS